MTLFQSIVMRIVKKEFEKKIFNFDYLLDPQIQQNNVYGLVAQDVVEGVLRGYNGTIFAYGQVKFKIEKET